MGGSRVKLKLPLSSASCSQLWTALAAPGFITWLIVCTWEQFDHIVCYDVKFSSCIIIILTSSTWVASADFSIFRTVCCSVDYWLILSMDAGERNIIMLTFRRSILEPIRECILIFTCHSTTENLWKIILIIITKHYAINCIHQFQLVWVWAGSCQCLHQPLCMVNNNYYYKSLYSGAFFLVITDFVCWVAFVSACEGRRRTLSWSAAEVAISSSQNYGSVRQ